MLAPVNEKSIVAFLMHQLEKIDSGNYNRDEIDDIVKIVNKSDKQYDREIIRLRETTKTALANAQLGTSIRIRELATKGFDDTTDKR